MFINPDNQEFKQFIYVPLCHQETPYTCGVASVQSILEGYGLTYTQDVLSEMLKQKPLYGTDYRNIISFMEMLGFLATFHIEMKIEMIKELIDNKITPLLMLQAWKEDDIDYCYDWRDSHYVIACGYDDKRIFFMDPWTLGYYTFLTYEALVKCWHTLDSTGLHFYYPALIIKHEQLPFCYNPNKIKQME